jgi:hypothetical protein
VPTEPNAWRDEPRSTRHSGSFGTRGSSSPGPSPAGPARPPRRRGFGTTAALVAAIFGGVGLVVSLTGLAIQLLPRHFSAAQQQRIMAWEVSKRWRTLPAGDIFPATVRYDLTALDLQDITSVSLQAARVGIAPQASCDGATDPGAARVLDAHGCQAVLRATYTDESATYVVTVGVAVLGSAAQAAAAEAALPPEKDSAVSPGLESASFAGTPAGSFGNEERQVTFSKAAGPYVIMYAAGYADGRPQVNINEDGYARTEMTAAAEGVEASVASTLAAPPPTPHCPGAPGC